MITIDLPAVRTLLNCLPLVSLLLGVGGRAAADVWHPRAPVPGARASHSAVWTGTEMIVWGGGIDGQFLDTGGRYDPATDTWQVTTLAAAPSPRWFHAAVWTGSEMLIWGGRPNFDGNDNRDDGGRYNPLTDEWSPISTIDAPIRRSQCAAVWTGSEMIIWGGATDGGIELNDGAKYNPATDTWTPISGDSGLEPRMEPAFVWTGTEMIVFGGIKFTDGLLSFGDGARYNPTTDSWTPLSAAGAPSSRTGLTAVWTGTRMVVWGGYEVPAQVALNTGASYDPVGDVWTPLPVANAPLARFYHAAVWTGVEMIVWGGQTISGEMLNNGARWNPAAGTWTATTQIGAPGGRQFWRPDLGVWTGDGMIIAAGSDYPASLDSTFIYRTGGAPPPETNCVAAPAGLAAWWRFDDNARDSVGAAHLVLAGEPGFVGGEVRDAIQFDGRSDEAMTPAAAALDVGLGEGFSIEAWANPSHVTMQPIVEWAAGPGSSGVHFWIGVYGSGSLFANLIDTGGTSHSWRSETDPVLPKVWQHVGMSYHKSSGLLRFYLDGVKVTEYQIGTFTPQTSYPLAVGYRPDQEHYAGLLDELSIYNRVLDDEEFAAIHAAGAGGKCATNAQPAQRVYDVSGDFSPNTNPAGAWSYGHLETLDGPLTLLPFAKSFFAENGVPISGWQVADALAPGAYRNMGDATAVSVGGAFMGPPGTVWFYPGDDGSPRNYGVIRFRVPTGRSGQYRIETSVRPVYDGPLSGDTDFHVTRNGQELFGQFLPPNSHTEFSNSLSLAEGDTIDFAVGRGEDGLVERSGLKLQATLSLVTNAPPPPALCVPPPAGIVAWWPGEGNPNDVIGTNRGTLLNDAGYAAGKAGRGFAFSGDPDGVRIAASPSLDVGTGPGLTIETWIHPDDLSMHSPLVEWNHGGAGLVTWGVHLYILPANAFDHGAANLYANLTDVDGNWHQITASGGTVRSGVWQHVALTYDRAKGVARLYRDGEIVSEQAFGTFIPQTTYDLYLGRRPAGDAIWSYRGSMDETAIYNRALSDLEIAAIARAGSSGKCRMPPALDQLTALVRNALANPPPLLAGLESVRASIGRGNLLAALNQLQTFQRKIRAQVAPADPALAVQFILLAQQIIEGLDPLGTRREALDAMAAEPLRVVRLAPASAGALRLEGRAAPGVLCGVERSVNLRDWEEAGDAIEVDDGRFEFIDLEPPTRPMLFYRLRAP